MQNHKLNFSIYLLDKFTIGKTNLFHTYATSSSLEVEKQFAAHYVWIRTFDYSETWVRLGIPTSKYEWTRVRRALNQ